MRFYHTSNIRLTLKTFSPAFEGIFKEHFTILLARQEQSSAITNRVLALRILFLLQFWNVLKTDLSVWGRVGEDDPPHLVMPLTIEPSKPRLCHDERFLNLWIRDLLLKLDYISDLPRYVGKYHFQTTMDDKSGYDHVEISEESRKYFGLQWQGWYFVIILSLLAGRAVHTSTTLLVWLLPATLDPWECYVASILMTDMLDSFLLPLNHVRLRRIGRI